MEIATATYFPCWHPLKWLLWPKEPEFLDTTETDGPLSVVREKEAWVAGYPGMATIPLRTTEDPVVQSDILPAVQMVLKHASYLVVGGPLAP